MNGQIRIGETKENRSCAVAKNPPRSEGLLLTNKVYANDLPLCLNLSLSGMQDCSRVMPTSRMVRTYAQVSEQELLATWMLASAIRFDSHEDRINVFERFRVVGFQDPTFLARIVFVKESQAESLLLVRASPAPRLKRTCVLDTRLCIQIERVDNQSLVFRKKNAAIRFVRPRSRNVEDIGHVKVTRADHLSNVAVVVEQLALFAEFRLFLIKFFFAIPHELR